MNNLNRMREHFCVTGMLLLAESGREAVMDHAGMEGSEETEVVVLAVSVRGHGALETARLRERLTIAMREWRADPRAALSDEKPNP